MHNLENLLEEKEKTENSNKDILSKQKLIKNIKSLINQIDEDMMILEKELYFQKKKKSPDAKTKEDIMKLLKNKFALLKNRLKPKEEKDNYYDKDQSLDEFYKKIEDNKNTGYNDNETETGNAQTIAVLAGGVDYIWPLENESLYYKILERGCIISEMPVGYQPKGQNFVQRNRWVAGLSDFLILSEADMKSGSMTTARFAIEYERRVFAVPGHPSDSRSTGPNSLIRQGCATLCMSPNDFFDEKNVNKKKNYKPGNEILDKLGMIPVSESVLANIVKKTVSEIKADLVVLELQGLIRKQDGGYVLN